jgi:glycosyltransferase involved in cell wall biosynthesis
MKIILGHKFLYPVGGTEIYFQNLRDILEQRGHATIPFAIQDERNPPSDYADYFLKPLDFSDASTSYKIKQFGRIVSRSLYSTEARQKIGRLIEDTSPDVAHLQVIENHMSPSMIDELVARGIPAVQSVNTYKHVCASSRLYLVDSHEICTRCQGGKHYHATLSRCVKGSLAASALATAEMYLHETLLKTYRKLDRLIVPNQFLEDKLAEAGYPREKLARLRNPFDLGQTTPRYSSDNYLLYFGRVEPEKGVLDLVKAMQQTPGEQLIVVGDGAQLPECQQWVDEQGMGNVQFLGPKWGSELEPILLNCRAVVVPSLWYEPSPYVIYQALAAGKPVIGNRVGGIPDLINEETGLLADPGNIDQLAKQINDLGRSPTRAAEMGRSARDWAERELSPASYYEKIMAVYRDIGAVSV